MVKKHHITVKIVKNYDEMSVLAAKMISEAIAAKPNITLGLATGGTPEGLYKILAAQKTINWSKVTTFNLDEYIGLGQEHEASYRHYMEEQLFKHININKVNTNVPAGIGDANANCAAYEARIKAHGGIDLQLLGLGENGHIAFNEPGSKITDRTRVVTLTESTISANARYFKNMNDVPKTAITMGIGTILEAKKIILIASGFKKAHAVRAMIDYGIDELVPASFLQKHPEVVVIVDEAAAAELEEYRKNISCGCEDK